MVLNFSKDALYLVDKNTKYKALKIPSPIKGYKVVDPNDIQQEKVENINATDFESVFTVDLKTERLLDNPIMKFIGFSSANIRALVSKILAKKVENKTIVVEGGPNKRDVYHAVAKEGEFKIHLGYSPSDFDEWWYPRYCWGFKIHDALLDTHTDYCIVEGGEHIKTAEGDIVATLVNDDLYVYLNIIDYQSNEMLSILEKILLKIKPIKSEHISYSKESYVDLCKKNIDSFKHLTDQNLEKTKNALNEARELFVKANRSFDVLLKKSSSSSLKDVKDHFSKQYDMMIANPYIEKLGLTNTKIIAHTVNIDAVVNGSKRTAKYDIGKFKITIDIETGDVKFTNYTRRVQGYNHPHIGVDGTPCLGSARISMAEFASYHEYGALLDMAIAFLLQINSFSTYTELEQWPERESKAKPAKKVRSNAAIRRRNR